MATRTVGDRDGEGKRETEAAEAAALEQRAALVELMSVQAEALAEALAESSGALAARLDGVLRETLLEAGRLGLERWAEKNRSECGAANAPRCEHCGGGMRHLGRERSPTETALGGVRRAMGRYGCAVCKGSARPRAARLDIEGSATGRTGCGGCAGSGSRTRSGSWTSSTPRSTCGRRRGGAGGTTRRPRSGGRRSSAGGSRRGGWTTCWRRCAGPARAPRNATRRSAACPSGAARCATTSAARSACRSVRGASRRPARRWWGGA